MEAAVAAVTKAKLKESSNKCEAGQDITKINIISTAVHPTACYSTGKF